MDLPSTIPLPQTPFMHSCIHVFMHSSNHALPTSSTPLATVTAYGSFPFSVLRLLNSIPFPYLLTPDRPHSSCIYTFYAFTLLRHIDFCPKPIFSYGLPENGKLHVPSVTPNPVGVTINYVLFSWFPDCSILLRETDPIHSSQPRYSPDPQSTV